MKSRTTNTKAPKELLQRPVVRIAGLLLLTGAVCGAMLLPKSTAVQAFLAQRKMDTVITDYVDKVVVQTLDQVTLSITTFNGAVSQLTTRPTDAAVAEAAQAWRAARSQWQAINNFAYGPCAFYDFNKQIAAWPIDRPMIDHSIAQMAAGKLSLDSRMLRQKINSTQRGFFTAEYLLFRDGQPRKAAQIRPAELSYLQAVAQVMAEESLDFQASWVGSEHMPKEALARLQEAGLPMRQSYGQEFKHPGSPESRYYSRSVVLQEMFQESQAVIDDTCPLIEEWLGSNDPRDSESRHSQNALADILSSLQSVENAYLGGVEGKRGQGMTTLVAAKDEVLDRRIRIALADVRSRVAAVGDPYGEPVPDRDLKLRIAAASCMKLASKYNAAVAPVCMDPVTEPWAAYLPKPSLKEMSAIQ